MCAWTYPMKKIFPEVAQASVKAQVDVKAALDTMNKHLTHRYYMISKGKGASILTII